MDCTRAQEILAIPAEDRTQDESAQLQEHLQECEACQKEQDILSRLDGIVGATLEAEAAAVPDFVRAPVVRRRLVWAAAAACVGLAIGTWVLGYLLGHSRAEVFYLKQALDQARSKGDVLEQQLQRKTEHVVDLEQTKPLAAPRTVNYYMFSESAHDDKVYKAVQLLRPGSAGIIESEVENETQYF